MTRLSVATVDVLVKNWGGFVANSKKETSLYAPVKQFLMLQGFEVKGEVAEADIVACREGEPPVIVELKTGFSLTLYHQAVARLAMTDVVYIAVPQPKGPRVRRILLENTRMCRRLGLGLLTVRDDGSVEVRAEPGPYAPRRNKKKAASLIKAFDRLEGDPNEGGSTRHGLVTGYRTDAVKCAAYLANAGAEKGAIVAKATGVKVATTIMRNNHYGWFAKVEKGVYDLTDAGRKGLADWADILGDT